MLSGGRLLFGIGVGYLEPEFRAVGAPYAARGAVTDEYLEAMQAIWSQAEPAYAGRHAAFSHVQAHPQPVQRPWPRVIVGGRSPAAFRRAVSRAHGWYGFGLDPAGAATALAGLREATKQVERPAALGPLEISLTPRGWGLERATAAEFAALGDSPPGGTRATRSGRRGARDLRRPLRRGSRRRGVTWPQPIASAPLAGSPMR